jgi:hypothetical protein
MVFGREFDIAQNSDNITPSDNTKPQKAMYTSTNFKTKKALKEALAAGKVVTVYDNSMFSTGEPINGRVTLEGPHYPAAHSWYGEATVVNNVVVKVS